LGSLSEVRAIFYDGSHKGESLIHPKIQPLTDLLTGGSEVSNESLQQMKDSVTTDDTLSYFFTSVSFLQQHLCGVMVKSQSWTE